jgi:hypothetical protein
MSNNLYFYILTVLVTTVLAIAVIGYCYNCGYCNYYATQEAQIAEAVCGKEDYGLVFVGSSRAHVYVSLKVIDSVTGLSSYNFGVEGGRIIEVAMVAKADGNRLLVISMDSDVGAPKNRPV